MGNLPKAKLPVEVLTIDGEEYVVRGLTRGEVKSLGADGEMTEELAVDFECRLLALACGVPIADAVEFQADAPFVVYRQVIEAAIELSGLGDVPKGSRSGSTPETSTDSPSF